MFDIVDSKDLNLSSLVVMCSIVDGLASAPMRPKKVAKEEKVKTADDSLSEADWLSEMHPHGEASSSLSGWETLEEDKSEICALNTQPARPVTMLSLLALSAPMLAEQIFTYSRSVRHAR
ncbi:hypothetical protein HKD37_03G006573 [Glycine soja]